MDSDKSEPTVRRDKSISIQSLERGERANLGGDATDRSRNRYSKDTPSKDDNEAFEGF